MVVLDMTSVSVSVSVSVLRLHGPFGSLLEVWRPLQATVFLVRELNSLGKNFMILSLLDLKLMWSMTLHRIVLMCPELIFQVARLKKSFYELLLQDIHDQISPPCLNHPWTWSTMLSK